MIIWFTGQPGAGKTTLAEAFAKILYKDDFQAIPYFIDGDDLRAVTNNKNYGFMGRIENVERAKLLARYVDHTGGLAIVSLVSPYRAQRNELKETNKVLEVYVHTSEIRGREEYHVKDYEPPVDDFIDIDTTDKTIEECANEVFDVYRKMATVA